MVIFLFLEVAPIHPELGISAASLWDQDSEGEEGGQLCFLLHKAFFF